MTASADRMLLERFERRRDETAFRELYRGHTPRLFALALRLTGGAGGEAEELVQEAWVRAITRLERFERRSSFRTWLSGILVNCYREAGRRRARAPLSLDRHEVRGAAARVVAPSSGRRRAERIDVERAIAHLPDGYREVVVLHDLNGHTHREIAVLLGIEEGTSKSQLARGRARLRQLLCGAGGAPDAEEDERGRP